MKDEVVTVDVSKFHAADYEPSLEVVAIATLECIRRTASDERQEWRRPILKIVGKPADAAKWKRWEEVFNQQDFSKSFVPPKSEQKEVKDKK
ncbi:hypothetical protein V2O64_17390 [Verrucomicrobiaceae bacterium 227]